MNTLLGVGLPKKYTHGKANCIISGAHVSIARTVALLQAHSPKPVAPNSSEART